MSALHGGSFIIAKNYRVLKLRSPPAKEFSRFIIAKNYRVLKLNYIKR